MCDADQAAPEPGPPVECRFHEAYYRAYFRQLVRLAALLTGDQDAAEDVACDALAALPPWWSNGRGNTDDVARYLQRQVLIRCRRIRPRPPGTPGFARLPVVRALQELPAQGREAIVLMHYLDLTRPQAAVVAGVSEAALEKRLRHAVQLLQDRLQQG
jgi:DNA-directed RNA polymerase specialized sigma24 family protein